jgi:hypothetical protein
MLFIYNYPHINFLDKLPFFSLKLQFLLKVPKWEISDGSDFHDFYTAKPFWVVTLGLKYKLVTETFGGARHHLIADAHAQCTHQFLTRMISMF